MSNQKFSQIEKAVLSTIAYYDIFDYPLKDREVWQRLYFNQKIEKQYFLEEVKEVLKNLNGYISEKDEFYFLKGRADNVDLRKKRFEMNKRKWKIAFQALPFLKMAPFLKMIAVSNTLAINNAREESDIDFFIIAEPGHIWSCRVFVTWFTSMLGLRRHKDKIKDKICLSFYITEEAMNLESLTIKPEDPHFTFWLSQFVPVYDRSDTFSKFVKANQWVKKILPNAFSKTDFKTTESDGFTSLIQKFWEMFFTNPFFGPTLLNFARDKQISKMISNQESTSHENNTKVVISDSVLKFHEEDRREEYKEKFEAKLKELNTV